MCIATATGGISSSLFQAQSEGAGPGRHTASLDLKSRCRKGLWWKQPQLVIVSHRDENFRFVSNVPNIPRDDKKAKTVLLENDI